MPIGRIASEGDLRRFIEVELKRPGVLLPPAPSEEGGPPTGPAGGALAGEYPDPVLASPLNLTGPESATDLLTGKVTGDASPRFVLNASGKLEWGSGAAGPDVDLSRTAANVLGTSDKFTAGLDLVARSGAAEEVAVGAVGPGARAGILFGTAGDVVLYRQDFQTLKTLDNFQVKEGLKFEQVGIEASIRFSNFESAEGRLYQPSGGEDILIATGVFQAREFRIPIGPFTVGMGWVGGVPGYLMFGDPADATINRAAAGVVRVSDALQLDESEAPAGAANAGRFFVEDNGSGKTRAMIQFATGAAQQIAIEP